MNTAKMMKSFGNAVEEIRDSSSEAVAELATQAAAKAKEATMQVDREAHRRPWYFIGAAAALAGVLGFVAGRKLKK